jgi:hypothetical protein
VEGDKAPKKKFNVYPIGYFHTASDILIALIEAVSYKIHTVLTDNRMQFRYPPRYANGPTARYITQMFEMRCLENDIEQCFTKTNHPLTNGQV